MDRTQNRGLPRPAPQIGASGRHDFELLFDGGFPEKAGVVVTMASILLAMGGFAFGYLRARMP